MCVRTDLIIEAAPTARQPGIKHREVVDLRVAQPFGDRVHDGGEGRATAFARLQQAKLQGEVPGLLTGEARIVREARPLLPAVAGNAGGHAARRSEEHTSELQSLMGISYAVCCLN